MKEIKMISKEDSCYATYRDQKHLDGELRKEIQIAWPNLDAKQLDELITPQDSHPKACFQIIHRQLPVHFRYIRNILQNSFLKQMKAYSRKDLWRLTYV